MDLGMVVPAMVAMAIGIFRRRTWARRAIPAAAGWAALLGTSVAGMAIVMQATGDPAAGMANTIAFAGLAALALALAWLFHRPLVAGRREGGR